MSDTFSQAPMVPGERPRFRLPATFNRGVFGGMVGGLLAAIVIVGPKYAAYARTGWYVPLLIVVGGALSAAAASASVQLGIAQAARRRWRGNPDITGGTVGGGLGGVLAGAYLGWFFGSRKIPPFPITAVMLGATVAVIAIALAVLLHGRRATALQTLRGLAVSTLVVGLTAFPLLSGLTQLHVDDALQPSAGTALHIAGGMLMGAILGALMGFQAGTTFWVVRKWDEMAALEPRHRRRTTALSRGVSAAFLWAIAAVCLFGGVVSTVQKEWYAGIGFLAMAGSLATAGRLRVKLQHKDFKVEMGSDAGADDAGAAEDGASRDERPANAGAAGLPGTGP